MNLVAKLLLILVFLALGLSSAALFLNRVPILDPPGWKTRLLLYMSKNSAETDYNSPLPELHPQLYPLSAQQLFDITRASVIELDWQVKSLNPSQFSINAIVITPLLGFKDDVTIRVVEDKSSNSTLHIRSESRIGRADYGANLSHVLKLKFKIQEKLRQK